MHEVSRGPLKGAVTVAKTRNQMKEIFLEKSDCTNEIFKKKTYQKEVLLDGV